MSKYRKRPVVIDAHQWFRNGDHPRDYSGHQNLGGMLVRRYRRPDVHGGDRCGTCVNLMEDHGWLDTLEGGHVVCPGDWIITGVKGEKYPCKPDIFEATYEAVN